jgi:hypothetical protein
MKFITEIKRIKSLINIFENTEKLNSTAIIGDKIAYYLNNDTDNEYSELIDNDMDFEELLNKVFSYDKINPQVSNVFISIGSKDFFDPDLDIKTLVSKLEDIFPNAQFYLIKGYIDSLEFNLDKNNREMIEDNSVTFFRMFDADRIPTIGNHSVIGNGVLERGEELLIDLEEIIDQYSEDFEITKIEDDNEIEIKNEFVDLDIDDDTDFDTIYEFLSNFEKMIKSKNVYSIDLKDKYLGDVELIQIALKFLDVPFSESLEINGKFDNKTKMAVDQYQNLNSLSRTGIVDFETLEEIFYDLKMKSFDDDDLGKFMGKLDVELKTYVPDDIDLEELCDRIIDNIEGGYANEVHFADAASKAKEADMKQAFLNSGETMFGIDRKNGPTMTEFWELVDENSGWAEESADKEKWSHGYMGGDIEDELREYVYEWAIPTFEDFKNKKLDSEAKKLVEEDERISIHLLYAVWNGIVFFNHFANVINSAVSEGITDRDELWKVALDSRKNHSNGAVRNSAPKIEKIANM